MDTKAWLGVRGYMQGFLWLDQTMTAQVRLSCSLLIVFIHVFGVWT